MNETGTPCASNCGSEQVLVETEFMKGMKLKWTDRDGSCQVGGDVAEGTGTGGRDGKVCEHSSTYWSRAPSPAPFILFCCQHIWVDTAVYTPWLMGCIASTVTSNCLNSEGRDGYSRSTKPAYMTHCFSGYLEKAVSPLSLCKCRGDMGHPEVTDWHCERLQCTSPPALLSLWWHGP